MPNHILPAVLFLKDGGVCVLTHKDGEGASIIYPDQPDTYTLTLAELEERYTDQAILCSVEPRLEERAKSIAPGGKSAWFWSIIRHYGDIYAQVAVASVVINCMALASPFFVMNVYDRVVPNNAVETLWTLAIGVAFVYAFNWLLTVLRTHFVDTAAMNADTILQSRLFGKTLTMKLEARPESIGALVNNIREFEQVREFFSSGSLVALIDLPFMLLFMLIILFVGGPLWVIPMIALPLLGGIGWWLQKRSRQAVRSAFKQNMHKNAFLTEAVAGLEAIKACGAETRFLKLWEAIAGASARTQYITRKYTGYATAISAVAVQLVTLVAIIWGCYRIGAGEMSLGALIAVNILLGRIMAPIMKLTMLLARLQSSRVAFEALDKIMELPSENDDNKACLSTALLPASFELDGVSFAYPGSRKPLLKAISLKIAPGEKVGIVGSIGSGKSTLLRLLVGLYAPTEGISRFGGVNMSQLAVAELRSRMGVCPQEVMLFYGSVKDNITLGDTTISDTAVLKAAEMAGVMEFLRDNPDGFAMQVGEFGKALSGGERQAVALARALVHDPEILILDEPTSNMDGEAEKRLQRNLQAIMADKTVIVVTHRASMLAIVDRVIALKGGEIVMDGPRAEFGRKAVAA